MGRSSPRCDREPESPPGAFPAVSATRHGTAQHSRGQGQAGENPEEKQTREVVLSDTRGGGVRHQPSHNGDFGAVKETGYEMKNFKSKPGLYINPAREARLYINNTRAYFWKKPNCFC